jgi:hypothetical protein
MVKMLLSVVLVATQVLSWNVSPLYLCLSADGSLCVDFGPIGCHCRQHDAAQSKCPGENDLCHGQLADWAADASNPCGCDHIQISQPQAATLVRAVAAPDSPHHVIPPAALLGDLPSGCCLLATGSLANVPLSGRDAPSAALVLLASVVIQC